MNPGTDSSILRQQAYINDDPLRVRHYIHEHYTIPSVDFASWALHYIQWRGDETVLDIGCGPGVYAQKLQSAYPAITYTGIDFSPGMLARHPQVRRVSVADAQALPYPAGSFDVVMANHMLYHVPDIEQAVLESRRVLKPGGILMAATNSIETMPQLRELYKRAILVLTAPGDTIHLPLPASHRFTLESGVRLLSRHFYAVARYDLPGRLVFDDPDPLMDYLESTRSLREPQLPSGVTWDSVMLIIREQIKNQLNYFGEMVVNKLSGVLLATDDGGFIEAFETMRRDHVESRRDDG